MENRSLKMPILFAGHGSPMNAIEQNEFTKSWVDLARRIPKPKAILAISAHWCTDGSRIQDATKHQTIYDMYGFPDALYQIEYKAEGAPEYAHLTKELISRPVSSDNSWGYDHGVWSVLCHMYPDADVPLYQLSLDLNASADDHFQIGRELRQLREKGVLIFASGNVVHNLARVNWEMPDGYPWAEEFDRYIQDKVANRQFEDVINYQNTGDMAKLAFSTPEHFYPLLYILGASDEADRLSISNASCVLGALSMTCYLFEQAISTL